MRNSNFSKRIYKEHVKLYRYINDECIFLHLAVPLLKKSLDDIQSKEKKEFLFPVPKKGKKVFSRREKEEVVELIKRQLTKDLFSKNIVLLISRMETHLQNCMRRAIKAYPQKLSILTGEKVVISTPTLINASDKEDLLDEIIEQKCSEIMFLSPQQYIQKFKQVLSIDIPESLIGRYIEIKAARDLIIHGDGTANHHYLKKAGDYARAKIGESLSIDEKYYESVVIILKRFAGSIMDNVEKAYC